MTTLFGSQSSRPLADRLRPDLINEVVEQSHLLGRTQSASIRLVEKTGSLSPLKHIPSASTRLMEALSTYQPSLS